MYKDKENLYRLLINNNDSFKITNKYVQDYLSGLYPLETPPNPLIGAPSSLIKE